MSSERVALIITLVIFVSNMYVLFQLFSSRFNLRVSIGILLLFTVCQLSAESLFGPLRFDYGGLRGLPYFPLLFYLLKGSIFQKLFAFSLELVLTVSTALLIGEVVRYLTGGEGIAYQAIHIILVLASCGAYVALVTKNRRVIYENLFAYGSTVEWAFYSLIGFFSFGVMSYSRMTKTGSLYFVVILVFILLSFSVLCFSIVNVNEKLKQRYTAEFARGIISSNREHYQKMDEMYDKLRTLRHDYKYHLVAISELLASGDKDELRRYLEGINAQFDESEIQSFCHNTVINALLTNYAVRCSETAITFTAHISLPAALTAPDFDLCIVIGNLLQNAVEACHKQEGGREIEIILKPLGEQLAIRVKNSFNGQVCTEDGKIKTTKTDGGFGLRSVEAVAARYNGEFLINWEGNAFSAYVTLPL